MMELARIVSAEWIGALNFHLCFADGAEDTVDLAPELGADRARWPSSAAISVWWR